MLNKKTQIITILLFILLTACEKKPDAVTSGKPIAISKENYLPPFVKPWAPIFANECLQIYYDKSKDPNFWLGEIYATMTATLASHFPETRQLIKPIEQYQPFEVYKCRYNIYLGSYFDNNIPEAFLSDFMYAPTKIAWLGYNIWELGLGFQNIFGYKYVKIAELNNLIHDHHGRPTFFKNFLYKGQVFSKYGEYNAKYEFMSSFEMIELAQGAYFPARVLSWAQHNGTSQWLPYALAAHNRFYIADIPFSFIHEADRYFIFADLLFDLMNKAPKRSAGLAFVRVEEVDPNFIPVGIIEASRFLKSLGIVPTIPIVPSIDDKLKSASAFASMNDSLKAFEPQYIWTGVKLVSKPDANFGFWDMKNNLPPPEDSIDFVLTRLEEGFDVFKMAGITPQIWMTPYNSASALGSSLFARIFPWRIGRTVNFNHTQQNLPPVDSSLYFVNGDIPENHARRQAFAKTKVTADLRSWSGQLFPYEVYSDLYEHRVLPENLGALKLLPQGSGSDQAHLLENAKRLSVVRDSWASFYVNIAEISQPEGQQKFSKVIQQLRQMGFLFISLDQLGAHSSKMKIEKASKLEMRETQK